LRHELRPSQHNASKVTSEREISPFSSDRRKCVQYIAYEHTVVAVLSFGDNNEIAKQLTTGPEQRFSLPGQGTITCHDIN
jgi:hypothetical protein